MDNLLYKLGKIPGALMILPLFLGALINTFAPAILNIGSVTTALFKNGVPVLIGLFFMCIGAQIQLRAALPAVEKGLVLLLGKYLMAVAVGLGSIQAERCLYRHDRRVRIDRPVWSGVFSGRCQHLRQQGHTHGQRACQRLPARAAREQRVIPTRKSAGSP